MKILNGFLFIIGMAGLLIAGNEGESLKINFLGVFLMCGSLFLFLWLQRRGG